MKKILWGVSAVLMILVAVIIFQQMTLLKLKKNFQQVFPDMDDAENVSSPEDGTSGQIGPDGYDIAEPSEVKTVRNNIINQTNIIKGVITKKEGDALWVEADVVDLRNLAKGDLSPEGMKNLPTVKKTFEVAINGKTEFESITKDELAKDMKVGVFAEELVYKVEKLTALKIGKSDEE
ncbi:MAG: hypothetical protein PHF35_01730 [Candidatus Moranbacteria bacterium]|nr:hypothetical protein [Candidatus Moranbacteria bacterium]